MRKYRHPLTKDVTPDNWKEKIDLDALSLEDLSTLIGDFKQMEKFGKLIAGFLKEVVIARMPEDEYEGPYFMLVRSEHERAGGLNKDKILEEMGEEWVEDHSNPPTEFTMLRVTERKDVE